MAKVITKNKDAHYSYELSDRIEAGIELKGWEVKSIRNGNVQLKGAFVNFQDGEAYLQSMHVSTFNNHHGHVRRERE